MERQDMSVTYAVVVTLAIMLILSSGLAVLSWHMRPGGTYSAPSQVQDDDPFARQVLIEGCRAQVREGLPVDVRCRELFAR